MFKCHYGDPVADSVRPVSACIQQLPAPLGVVMGALGSCPVVMRGEQVRFRREQAARWEERWLAAYADYARQLKKTATLTYRVAAHLGNDPHPHPPPQGGGAAADRGGGRPGPGR